MNVMEVTSFPTLEAFVFDCVSIGIFNLWTWLAVLTATFSLWKLRSSSSSSDGAGSSSPPPSTSPPLADNPKPVTPPSPQSSSPPLMRGSEKSSSSYFGFIDDGVTKGKFVLYYEDDVDVVCDVNGRGDGEYDDGEMTVTESWKNWERVRMEEMGWCRFQDLTVINGNVVRLWDDVKRRSRNYKEGQLTKLSFNCCFLVD